MGKTPTPPKLNKYKIQKELADAYRSDQRPGITFSDWKKEQKKNRKH